MAFALTPQPPIAEWLADLDASLEQSKGFFAGHPVASICRPCSLEPRTRSTQLLASLEERNIRVLGIEGLDPAATTPGLPPVLRGGRNTQEVELSPEAAPVAAAPAPRRNRNSRRF